MKINFEKDIVERIRTEEFRERPIISSSSPKASGTQTSSRGKIRWGGDGDRDTGVTITGATFTAGRNPTPRDRGVAATRGRDACYAVAFIRAGINKPGGVFQGEEICDYDIRKPMP
jgi:hypothetical protein